MDTRRLNRPEPPEATFALPLGVDNEDDLMATAGVLAHMVNTAGWDRFLRLLGDYKVAQAIAGHHDDSKRPGYYGGLLDGIDRAPALVQDVLLAARSLELRRREADAKTRRDAMGLAADRRELEETGVLIPPNNEDDLA